MFQKKTLLIIGSILLLTAALAFVTLIRFQIKPDLIEKKLVPHIEEMTEGAFQFSQFNIEYFPLPYASFSDVKLSSEQLPHFSFQAEEVDVYVSLFSLLLGRAEASKIIVKDGDIRVGMDAPYIQAPLSIEHFEMETSTIRPNRPIKFNMAGDFEGMKNSISLGGVFQAKSFHDFSWKDSSFTMNFSLSDLEARNFQRLFLRDAPFKFLEGDGGTSFQLQKAESDDGLSFLGEAKFEDFMYEMVLGSFEATKSKKMDVNIQYDFLWRPLGERIDINSVVLGLPTGDIEMTGGFLVSTGEVLGMRISAFEIAMESLPQYVLPLQNAMPYNFGFSGLSDLEMSVEGTLDHLSLHANWDFTNALLTYDQYFAKPRQMPLNVIFDFLIRDNKVLSGDFSMRLQDASIKGTFSELDIHTGEGQLNIITNKFDVKEWQPLLTVFTDYDLAGNVKVLLNSKGNLKKINEAEKLLNLTFENGSIKKKGSQVRPFTGIKFLLDYSPLSLDIKGLDFKLDDEVASGGIKIYGLHKNPILTANLTSDSFKLADMLESFKAVSDEWLTGEQRQIFEVLQSGVNYLFPLGYPVQNFNFEVKAEGEEWDFSNISFEAFDGKCEAQATLNYDEHFPTYWTNFSVDQMSLAKFSNRREENAKLVDGKLFFQGQFVGVGFGVEDWTKRVQGEGDFMVTNGEFYTFDVLGAVAEIEGFSELDLLLSETTRFDDLHGEYRLKNQNFEATQLVLMSPDFKIETEGTLSLEGLLNYRLDVYLSPTLATDALAPLLKVSGSSGDRYFGPITLLLSGELEDPILKPDSILLSILLDEVERRKSHKVLRNFLPEDSFFARSENN